MYCVTLTNGAGGVARGTFGLVGRSGLSAHGLQLASYRSLTLGLKDQAVSPADIGGWAGGGLAGGGGGREVQ